jgi:hypothetical protein
MRIYQLAIIASFAALASCGAPQQQAQQEPYSAPSSPDATGQVGYATDPGYANQQETGAEGGRGSAATGATGDGASAGDANSQAQPAEQTP